jgi:hypothetical protein
MDEDNILKPKYIALCHEFVSLENFPGSITSKELVKKLPGFNYIFCGHNHKNFEAQVGNTKVINIGSMMRADADQIDFEPGFYAMYEDFSVERILFDIEKDVIDRKYLDYKKETDERLESFVESLNNKYEISNSFKNNLENHIKENNTSDGVKNKILGAVNE